MSADQPDRQFCETFTAVGFDNVTDVHSQLAAAVHHDALTGFYLEVSDPSLELRSDQFLFSLHYPTDRFLSLRVLRI
jgi:hypothetical protein